MGFLITIVYGLGGTVFLLVVLNIINILQAGSRRSDGRSMQQILCVDPERATYEDIERLPRREKMQLFHAAEPIDLSELEGEYESRLLSGGVLGPSSAIFTHHVFPTGGITLGTRWIGKGFTKTGEGGGWGYNLFSRKAKPGGDAIMRIRKMKTSIGPTRIGTDGKASFHLDYSPFNKDTVRSMRDEIRKINDNLYIGAGHMALGGGALNPAPFVLIGPPKPWVGADGDARPERAPGTGLPEGKATVLIKRCENYDRENIGKLIREGMDVLGYRPSGNVFVKPNVVFASKNGQYGATAYTDPAVVGAALLSLSNEDGVNRVDMGEKTAIGYPTRLTYQYAGYYDEVRNVRKQAGAPVRAFCIDESRRDSVFVGGLVHDNVRLASPMARADTKVYLPKLKCHCVSTMTGAVKLNIGICSDDERAIRHDFMLNEKIVDLLSVGYPDFIVMDAVDVGVGNEAVPTPRRLGLILMGTNPLAVDIVGARLLGYDLNDVPYLKRAVERGYGPDCIEDVDLQGDLRSVADLDEAARRIMPYDDQYTRWQDISRELERLQSPIRFFWGYTGNDPSKKCETGCIMGAKMFFGFQERYAGEEAFQKAKPVVMVIGRVDDPIDARGEEAFLIGACARADIRNAKKITRIDNCFTTAVEMAQVIRGRLGMPAPILDPTQVLPLTLNMGVAAFWKFVNLRYFQDVGHFLLRGLQKRI